MSPSPRRVGSIEALLAGALFGLSGILTVLAARAGMEAMLFSAIRSLACAAAIVLVAGPLGHLRGWRVSPGERGAFVSAVGTQALTTLLIFAGFATGPIGAVLLAFYTHPALAALIEALRGRRAPSIHRVGALGAALLGLVVLLTPAGETDGLAAGVLFGLAAAVSETVCLFARRGFPSVASAPAAGIITFVGAFPALALALVQIPGPALGAAISTPGLGLALVSGLLTLAQHQEPRRASRAIPSTGPLGHGTIVGGRRTGRTARS